MSDYLDVQRIEFAVTHRCNSHCKHCQVEERERTSLPAVIDRDIAVRFVRQVAGAYPVRSLMTFGGEPLLYPDTVCAIHQAARECGIAHRSVITNAGVPRSEDRFRRVAERLAESGVNAISVSVDAFHQEHLSRDVVERNVRTLVDAGIGEIRWNPCWVIAREHDNAWNRRTREILQSLVHLPVVEDEGNTVQPDGNAPRWLGEFMPLKVALPDGTCGDMPYTGPLDEVASVTVDPDGSVSVCWEWAIGNAAQKGILDVLQRYDPYQIPEARALLEGGLRALVALAHSRGIELDSEGYYSVCDACRSIRREMSARGSS